MGPHCKFCGQRCFNKIPKNTPPEIVKEFKGLTIVATCPEGQELEKSYFGYNWDDLKKYLPKKRALAFGAGKVQNLRKETEIALTGKSYLFDKSIGRKCEK